MNVKKYSLAGEMPLVDVYDKEDVTVFLNDMIIMPRTVKYLQAIIKPNNYIVLDRIYYLQQISKQTELKFVLALINSKLISFWFEYYFSSSKVQGNYFDLNGNQIQKIPILNVSLYNQRVIINLVDQILTIKRTNSQADTSRQESEIDKVLYGLYALSEDEIKLVELN